MKGKKIFRALRDIDPQLILDAAPGEKIHSSRAWVKWGALAACLCLVATAALLLLPGSPISSFPHIHAFSEWETTKEATCSAQGKEMRICACGEEEIRYTALLPHFAGGWVVEKEPTIKLPTPDDPTEREPGLKCQFCDRCGAKLDEELIPATGSLGLAYAVNLDGKTFSVAGIGNCTDEDIIIPENFCGYHVTSVIENAFAHCHTIKSISLPETITVIEDNAFYGSSLVTASLNEGLNKIGAQAFSSSNRLKNIVIPSTVTEIGERAFQDCYSIEEIVVPNGVTVLGDRTFAFCWSLKSVILPNGLTSIGTWAFSESRIQNIKIPSSVKSIGEYAFYRCERLESVELPQGLQRIERDLFARCEKLVNIVIPDSVTYIGYSAFSACASLEKIDIPAGVTVINGYTFEECEKLTSVTLPKGIESIGEAAFIDCVNLKELFLPDSVRYIGAHAFGSCDNLLEVENGVSYLGRWAVNCTGNVTEVVLREDTVGISDYAFGFARSLERITLPNGLKHIGSGAMPSGYTLKEIIYDGTKEEWETVEKASYWWNDYSCVIIFTNNSNESQ